MSDCLFCKISAGEIPADIVVENETVVAFRDIDPKAPTHILVIPREHHSNVSDLMRDNPGLSQAILSTVTEVAQLETLEKGFRVVTNVGSDGGQSVNHVHFHVLGGRELAWPPG